MRDETCPYVSRGGLKLAAALDAFGLDPAGWVCADLGCSTGGFTDCLLQRGAAHVYAVDTAYGELAWKLRQDERVTVLERTNALHFDPWQALGESFGGCDLVVVDLGWTVQARAVPAALRWLRRTSEAELPGAELPGGELPEAGLPGVVSLIKPHYESTGQAMGPAGRGRGRGRGRGGRRGVLDTPTAERVLHEVLAAMPALGVQPTGHLASPIRGGKGGNLEYLAHLRPLAAGPAERSTTIA